MKLSVVTPSYNQAQFLPDNIRTVSGQKNVNLEHIIVDPGSTDGSLQIARSAKHAILINEPDRGQSHGITKGYDRATGDILVWLNSDDFYPDSHVLSKVVNTFLANPEADIVYGNVNFVDENGKFLRKGYVNSDSSGLLSSFQYQVGIVQPGVFMRRRVFESVGGPSENYEYCMDYEYWVRKASSGFKWHFINETLAHHRWWPGMKTSSGRGPSLIEHFNVCYTYFGYIHYKWLDRYAEFLASGSDGVVNHSQEFDQDLKNSCIRRAIERFVTQDMIRKLEKSSEKELVSTLEYLNTHSPRSSRRFFYTRNECNVQLAPHSDPHAEQKEAWYIFDAVSNDSRFKLYTVPKNFSRLFRSEWYYFQLERAKERMHRISRMKKECCIIVANGPSLNKVDFSLLSNADVIISNFATISNDLLRHATYLTVVNDLVAQQGSVHFNDLDIIKFVPFWLSNTLNPTDSTYFLPATVEPRFCTDIGGTFSWRSTVSFLNMQLAYVLGYKKVILIGFDHSYQQPKEVKEGTSISQKEEDPNHFDPRYFMGKTWQAADTENMEKMYRLAYDAFKSAGRTIVNATVGGKLEVFPRMKLETALGLASQDEKINTFSEHSKLNFSDTSPKSTGNPNVLIFDTTPMGDVSATAEIKVNIFADYPSDKYIQISKGRDKDFEIVKKEDYGFKRLPVNIDDARNFIAQYRPGIVLYRPVPDDSALHSFAMSTIKSLGVPLVIWIMDDWPKRMETQNHKEWKQMERDLLFLLNIAALRLSISKAMSEAFKVRYGVEFTDFANGVDPKDWPVVKRLSAVDQKYRIRFAGGLAPDMNRDSIIRIADAVEEISASGCGNYKEIVFQIHTQTWWYKQVEKIFSKYRATQLYCSQLASASSYRRWISECDALCIAYNFDSDSTDYVRYSMANKMPECLASGTPTFIYGPSGVATVDYLSNVKGVVCLNSPSRDELLVGLRRMISSAENADKVGALGREHAFTHHNIIAIRSNFYNCLRRACQKTDLRQKTNGQSTVSFLRKLAKKIALSNAPDDNLNRVFMKSYRSALVLDPESVLEMMKDNSADLPRALQKVSMSFGR